MDKYVDFAYCDIIPYGDGYRLVSALNLSKSDFDVLSSIAQVYSCSIFDVVLRSIKSRISAYNFVHEKLKPWFELNQEADVSSSGKLDIPDEIGIVSGIAHN